VPLARGAVAISAPEILIIVAPCTKLQAKVNYRFVRNGDEAKTE